MLASGGQIFLKLGASTDTSVVRTIFNWNILFGVILYGLAVVLYLLALRNFPLSVAYPIVAISYVFVLILSAIFLNETLNLFKLIGVGFIVLGTGVLMFGD